MDEAIVLFINGILIVQPNLKLNFRFGSKYS